METVKSAVTQSIFYYRGDFIVPRTPYTFRKNNNSYVFAGRQGDSGDLSWNECRLAAVVRIQLWYKAWRSVNIVIQNGGAINATATTRRILYAFLLGELRLVYQHKQRVLEVARYDVRVLIDEVIENSLSYCLRKEAAVARVLEYEQTPLNASMMSTLISNPVAGATRRVMSSVTGAINGMMEATNGVGNDADAPVESKPIVERKSMFSTIFGRKT